MRQGEKHFFNKKETRGMFGPLLTTIFVFSGKKKKEKKRVLFCLFSFYSGLFLVKILFIYLFILPLNLSIFLIKAIVVICEKRNINKQINNTRFKVLTLSNQPVFPVIK